MPYGGYAFCMLDSDEDLLQYVPHAEPVEAWEFRCPSFDRLRMRISGQAEG